jgi:hypothetical protein
MMHSRDEVIALVQATFPEESWGHVLELLDSYGVKSYERERERVQLDILKLSVGSEEKVREYVAVAKRDYRDVLFWAEYPEESRLDTSEKRERVRKCSRNSGSSRRMIYNATVADRRYSRKSEHRAAHNQQGNAEVNN